MYTPDLGKDGQVKLVVTGKEDLQGLYNSYRDSCEPSVIIQRFLDTGDQSLITRSNPVFLDLLGTPKSLAEAYALNFRAEAAFAGLPAEVRDHFGNNYYNFLEQAGSEDWFSKLQLHSDTTKEVDTSEKQ